MKASRFNFNTVYPLTGETLLFNTLTGAFSAFDPETSARVERLLRRTGDGSEDSELAAYLSEQGMLVDDEFDELEVVRDRNRLGISDPNRLDVIVMPNMNCNLACIYCYESHAKSAMSNDTSSHLIAWLQKTVPRFKMILLSWFGGEPLLSYETVVRIQRAIRDLCAEHHVGFSSHITTNGFMLSPDRASELTGLELYSYQITLDGPRDVHDAMRPLRGGGGSFDRIMTNIISLARMETKANIKLRVNYNEENLSRIPALLALFPEDVRPNLDVVYERIFGEEYSGHVHPMPAKRVGTTVESMYQCAREFGFKVTKNQLDPDRLTYCYADRRSQFVVNYNGDVFKCTVDKFKTEDRLGSLCSDGSIVWEAGRIEQWHGLDSFESKCYSCKFMPMCMGGCRKVRLREGTVGENCKLPFMGFDRRMQNQYARERGDRSVTSPPHESNRFLFSTRSKED